MRVGVLVLGGFVLGSRIALAKPSPLTFSPLMQCGPTSVQFPGDLPQDAFPLSLSIVPFDSVPVVIQIQKPVNGSTQSRTNVIEARLPFTAGTNFVGLLQDSAGHDVSGVSDVVKVLPSSDSSCVGNFSTQPDRRFAVASTPSQCEPISVTFSPSVISQPPTVRALVPNIKSIPLALVHQGTGLATYTLTIFQGFSAILLLDDGHGYRESSIMFTVRGDARSDSRCFPPEVRQQFPPSAGSQPGPVRLGIVVTLITLTVVSSLVALYLIFHTWRQRHVRRSPEPSPKDVEAGINNDPPSGRSWSLAPLRRFLSKDAEESGTSEPPSSPVDSIRTWFDEKLYKNSIELEDNEGQAGEIPSRKAGEKARGKMVEKANKQVDLSGSFLDLASEADKESIRTRDSLAAVELGQSPTRSQPSPTLGTGPVTIKLKPSLRLRHDSGPADVPTPVGLPAHPRVTKARRRLSLLSLRQGAGSKPTIQNPALRVHFTPSYRETSVIPMPPPGIVPTNNEPLVQATPISPPRKTRRIPPPLAMTRNIRPRSSFWYGGIAPKSTASPAPSGTL